MNMTLITAESLVANPVNIQNLGYTEDNTNASLIGGNLFKVQLPVADHYNIRTLFISHLEENLNLPISYDVTCVNGISNKTRVSGIGRANLLNTEQWQTFLDQRVTKYDVNPQTGRRTVNGTVVGIDKIKIAADGLEAGDYIKLKLNVGEHYSYSELWIELI
jgi:hypothetical protein